MRIQLRSPVSTPVKAAVKKFIKLPPPTFQGFKGSRGQVSEYPHQREEETPRKPLRSPGDHPPTRTPRELKQPKSTKLPTEEIVFVHS